MGSAPAPIGATTEASNTVSKADETLNPTRFDQDMDGSMGPSEHGRWVRFDDHAAAMLLMRNALSKVCADDEEIMNATIDSQCS